MLNPFLGNGRRVKYSLVVSRQAAREKARQVRITLQVKKQV